MGQRSISNKEYLKRHGSAEEGVLVLLQFGNVPSVDRTFFRNATMKFQRTQKYVCLFVHLAGKIYVRHAFT